MLKVKRRLVSLLSLLEAFNKADKKTHKNKRKWNKNKDKEKSDENQIKETFDNTFSNEGEKALKEQRVKRDFSKKKI